MTALPSEAKAIAERSCIFSEGREYRYTLWRSWPVQELALTVGHDVDPRPFEFVQFIGLNPSTADETVDDNTIRRCVDFAKRFGFGGMCMTNLFAWRDTDPRAMKRAEHPIGPDNDRWLEIVARDAAMIVCCWGNHGNHGGRANQFLELPSFLERYRTGELKAFGLSRRAQPKHPLMLAKLTKVQPLVELYRDFYQRRDDFTRTS